MKKILTICLSIIMMITLFPMSALAQTGFGTTNSYNDLAVNYVQIDRIPLAEAEITSTNGNIRVVKNLWEVTSGSFNDTAVYYNGPLNWGSANVTETVDAQLGITNIPGSVALKWANNATLSDGTKADVKITIDNFVVAAGAKPASLNANDKINCVFLDNLITENNVIFTTQRVRTGFTLDTVVRNQIAQSYDIQIDILKPGTEERIDATKYPTMLFGAVDLDIDDKTTATGKTSSERYAGKYSEGGALLSGFNGPIYLTEDTQSVIQTVDGNTKVRGTAADDSTMKGGFAVSATTQGFKFRWYGSTNVASSGAGRMGTVLGTFQSVRVVASSNEGGSIEKTGSTTYLVNSQTTYDYTPEEGYKVKSLKVDGSNVAFDKNGGTYTFEKLTPKADNQPYTIDVEFERKDYKVAYTSDEGGEITGRIEEYRDPNEKTRGTTQQDGAGYRFSCYIADVDVTLEDGTVIKKGEALTQDQIANVIVNSDITFTAIHNKLYEVTYQASQGGNITGKEEEIRADGELATGSAKEEEEGYYFTGWTVDSDVKLNDGTTIPAGPINEEDILKVVVDHNILFTANFAKIPEVTVEKIADKDTYGVDEEIAYTITVKQIVEGAKAQNVVITDALPEGMEITSEVTSTLGEVRVDANSITVKINELSSEEAVITFTVKANKEVVITPDVLNTVNVASENAEPVSDEVSVNRVVRVLTSVTNGTIDDSMENVPVSQSPTITYSANEGYHISEIRINGVPVPVDDNPESYTFSNITDNQDIEVICEKNAYEITTEVVNGTISGGGTAFYGDNKTVLFEPEDGYRIASVEIDGIEMNVEDFRGSHEFTNITSSHHIKVVYEAIPEEPTPEPETYTVTFVDGYGNTLKIQDNILLHGSATAPETPTIEGMVFKGWDISFDDITEDITVTALWEPAPVKAYVIKTSAENGTIDPMIGVAEGRDQTIRFSPKDGYTLSKVFIDGKEIEIKDGMAEYTFKNVTEDHEIKVVYKKVEVPNKVTPEKPIPKKSAAPKTGDNANALPYILIGLMAVGTAIGIIIKRKALK